MSRAPNPYDVPRRLLEAATEVGATARLYLDGSREAFTATVLGVNATHLILSPVQPTHGNLVLERLLGEVRLEVVIGGLPHEGAARITEVRPDAVCLSLPPLLERVQRRRYYRVQLEAPSPVEICVGDRVRTRRLLDVSGGGCAFIAEPDDADLTVGTELTQVSFQLGNGDRFESAARVQRRGQRDTPEGRVRVVALELVSVPARERYKLIGWVTEAERGHLRRRSAERPRPLANAIVLFHDPDHTVRFKLGREVGAGGVSVVLDEDDVDLVPSATHPHVELRVGGQLVLRTDVSVARVESDGEQRIATLAFGSLGVEDKTRLLALLRPV